MKKNMQTCVQLTKRGSPILCLFEPTKQFYDFMNFGAVVLGQSRVFILTL